MEMIYKFRSGSRVNGDAQLVGETLANIRTIRGRLIAGDVVEEAKPDESPLHRYFEWDNDMAAKQWREEQARHLIAAVVVVSVDEEEITPVRAWCKVWGQEGYEEISTVLACPDLRDRALREVRSSIKTLREKLDAFQGLTEVIGALDAVDAAAARASEGVGAVPG